MGALDFLMNEIHISERKRQRKKREREREREREIQEDS